MPRAFLLTSAAALAISLAACSGDPNENTGGTGGAASSATSSSSQGGGSTGTGGAARPPAAEDFGRDILTTDLELDLATLAGKATITLAPSASKAASFEIGDLAITSVEDDDGPLDHQIVTGKIGSQLDVGVPAGDGPAKIVVTYTFKAHDQFDGWMPVVGVTFLWPYFCGNLFPCKSDPADGVKFTMKVTGAASDLVAVYPAAIPADAPSYMPAIAVAKFTKLDLGKTSKGTQVSAWHLPGQDQIAAQGTEYLRGVFDFYETTYGAYPFGGEVGSVSANWGPGAYGGMEHHPYWHVGKDDFGSHEVHAHEAAHGWFGDGVRIACWEDFVLSEGTVTYLAAHALEALGVDIWPDYECNLQYVCDPDQGANTIALPDTCDAIDILDDPLWSLAPYMKGAYFYRDVANAIGADVLDAAIAEFYQANVGKPAKMQAMIDHIKSKADAAEAATIDQLAKDWLQTLDCPVDYTTLCP